MNQENKANPAPQICEYHPGKQCQGGARSSWGIFSSLKVVVVGLSMPWRFAFVKRTPVAVEPYWRDPLIRVSHDFHLAPKCGD